MKGLVLVLFVAAILLVGGGMMVMLTKGFSTAETGDAIGLGIGLAVLGMIPLSGVAICLAVDEARKDILAALRKE